MVQWWDRREGTMINLQIVFVLEQKEGLLRGWAFAHCIQSNITKGNCLI